ncbi:MAG: hypothetical protein GXP26_11155 [Planctomycetes bacterium]|nr:hypothetical protein [Planctomycetota bacterium]
MIEKPKKTAMSQQHDWHVEHPSFEGRVGVARRDITPPVGIYSRMWGSAEHDVAQGIHRPLTVTVLTIQSLDNKTPLVLASLDLGWWRSSQDEWFLRAKVLDALSLEESRLMLHLTHTHSGPSTSLNSHDKPGGHLIKPYLVKVCDAVVEATLDALDSATPATLDWNTGRCDLACFRDQPNPEGPGMVVGCRPDFVVDDTLLLGRVSDIQGRTIATLVNYACHPTTLGGGNQLISPDYVGAMREVVEEATRGAPCLFLNGAAGDLAPRRQYLHDPSVADQNGRQLGYAALSTLAGMLPPRTALEFDRVETSGARLGRWHLTTANADTICRSEILHVRLPLRPMLQPSELECQLAICDDRVLAERLERQYGQHNGLAEKGTTEVPVWIWQLGSIVFLGTPAEMHSPFQAEIRKQFTDQQIVVMNLTNGTTGYLPPKKDYPQDTYQTSISLFGAGCHEAMLAACIKSLKEFIKPRSGQLADSISKPSEPRNRRSDVSSY